MAQQAAAAPEVAQAARALARKTLRQKGSFQQAVAAVKRALIIATLADCDGNLCAAARQLRMHRNTLYRLMVELRVMRALPARKPAARAAVPLARIVREA